MSAETVAKLIRVLIDVGAYKVPAPSLVPLPSGGVQAEWHFLEQSIEIGVEAGGEIFAYASDVDGVSVVEMEDAWFIPNDQAALLKQGLLLYARRVGGRGE
ncbi:hypothetical protein [Umezawaea sp. NPDC059074]|uniref:hypothetical protein n=1 Tax=Umezawaea sp. NPDC059074 TaxID=3346716 RepID=UPI00369FFAE0